MKRIEIIEMSYDMVKAYEKNETQGEAVEYIKNRYPTVDLNILWAMWMAIDAYVDQNVAG